MIVKTLLKGDTILCLKNISNISGGGKIPSEIKSQSKKPKNLIHDHTKIKQFILYTAFGVLIGTTPIAANVTDNLSGPIKQLLGSREMLTDESAYSSAPANAKINYLEKRIVELQDKVDAIKQIIESK